MCGGAGFVRFALNGHSSATSHPGKKPEFARERGSRISTHAPRGGAPQDPRFCGIYGVLLPSQKAANLQIQCFDGVYVAFTRQK
jgi:hypothetical protein